MSNCAYRILKGPDGKEVTIVGKAEMQAYMAAHLDFFSAKGNFNFKSKAGLEVSVPEPAGANVAPADDLDAMFDEVLAEEVGAKQEKPKRNPATVSKAGPGATATVIDPSAMGGQQKPRTAGQAAASAAKNTAAGIGDTIAALGKLFGGSGKLSSGLTFDEQTYAKAKPLFKQAIAHFRDAGQDIKEAMRAVVRMVLDQFGADTAQNMKPYVVRFMEDVRDGKINYDEKEGGERGNDNEQRGSTGEQGDAALGGVPAAEDGRPEGSWDVRDAGETGRGAGDGGNSGAGAKRGARGRGRGNGAAGVHPTEARAEAGVSPSEAPAAIPAKNFVITEDVRLGKGGEIEKYNDNLRAIQIVKTLEAERRRATPEEQVALARYAGWGGLPSAFRNRTSGEVKKGWESRVEALEKLLTKDELDAARRSTMDAHYTAQPVVEAMWKAAQRLGFAGGIVLEPSVGVGNFIGLTPWNLGGKTSFVGIEYDGITARIARALYPQSSVLHSGFQDVPLQTDGFDLAIGNPPFGGQSLYFPYSDHVNGMSIHNQFFVASMDAVKPGGLQIMVVSRYLMDAKDSQARRMLAEKAELLGAIRLPDSAFQENARTEVVTDILFLKKRSAALGSIGREVGEEKAPAKPVMPAWVETTEVADPLGGEPITVNRYFAENPQMMLGSLERSGSMRYENDVTLRANPGEDIREALDTAISRLPELPPQHHDAVSASLAQFQAMRDALEMSVNGEEEGAIKFDEDGNLVQVVSRELAGAADMLARRVLTPDSPWSPQLQMDNEGRWFRVSPKLDEAGNKVKSGRFVVYDRETFASDKDVPESLRLGAGKFERLKALAGLRDLLKKQLNLESADEASDVMEENRAELAAAYKAFVKAHGFINAGPNQALLSNMPDGPLVSALEMKYDPGVTAARARRTGQKVRKESAEPAPIMSQRVVLPYVAPTKAQTGAEALTISLSESGKVDLERMAALLGKSEQGVIDELFTEAESPLIFRDPETGEWQTRDAYLSGQVVKKLAAARDAGLEKNATALEAVQPPPLGAADISIRLGQSWVPTDIYAEFAQKIIGGKAAVHFSKAMNQFDVSGAVSKAGQAEWGTERATPLGLIEAMMNSRAIAVYDYFKEDGKDKRVLNEEETQLANAKATEIANEFADWIMSDADRRSRLVEIYNREFNNRVVRQYDGSHLILPGKVPDAVVKLRRHQKNVIWRGISERFLLIDHVVGSGKSFSSIARAMERRRMGLAKKPVIVVPNHMVEQFSADVYRLYPGARVLAAGKKDFEAKKRRRLFSKIATGDWDIVVVPHSSFGFIGISPEREAKFIQEEIESVEAGIKEAEAEDSGDGWRKPQSVKDGERLLERLNERMKRIKDMKRDKLLTFEQMGVDDLTIDEAHCLPHDASIATELGPIKIGEIVDGKVDVRVLSFDSESGQISMKKITGWFNNPITAPLVRVSHECGEMVCTANHKVWTIEDGYVAAGELSSRHHLVVAREGLEREEKPLVRARDSREELHPVRNGVQVQVIWGEEQRKAGSLLESVCGEVEDAKSRREEQDRPTTARWSEDGFGTETRVKRPEGVGEDEEKQSNEVCRGRREDAEIFERENVLGEGRERCGNQAAACRASSDRAADGVRNRDSFGLGDVRFASELLQGGSGAPRVEDGNRNRREDASTEKVEILGCKKDGGSFCSRVVGVEVLERGSGRGLGVGGAEDQRVYCLEVEENHNFFADGVLVSNCFKNLAYYTRLTKVLGLGSKEGSKRAWDLYNKVRVLRESPRGAVTFMTGTPISNSIVEMYTMMRYLAMDDLKDLGLEHFDAWHKQFAEAVTKFELNDANQLAEKTRLARWSNMPELMKLYYSFTDAVSLDDIKKWYAEDNGGKRFPVPAIKGGKRNNIIVQPTPAQEAILEGLVSEFNGLKDIKDPRERNKARLRLMDRARKVSLDARAVDPRIPTTEPGGKLEKVADEVARIHKEWASDKGTQLVFLDRSVPKSKGDEKFLKMYDALVARKEEALRAGDEDLYDSVQEELDKFNPSEVAAIREAQAGGWNAYEQIKRNLMARGVPENEIRFIQEANTDDQKQQLFDAVKAGEVRVLLGSTERMGAGTNVQDRLVALHHVDVNWKPSDIEQREGRGIRQGNLLLEKYGDDFEVELNAYATERTYDAKMWSLNEAKGRFINGLRSYDGEREVEIDDSESENMAEMAAMASGDPRMLERVQLDAEVKRLELARRSYGRRKFSLEDAIQRAERNVATLPAKIEGAKQDQKRVNDAIEEAENEVAARRVDVEGEEFSTEFEAQKKARELIDAQKGENPRAKFTLMVNGRPYTSVDAVEKAIRRSLGDPTAFPFEMDTGERFTRRAVAASAVAARMNDMLAEGKEEEAIGTYYGLPVRAFVSREGGEVRGTLFVQGESVKEARDVRTSDTGQFGGENVQNSMATLARDIRDAVNIPSMQRQLAEAQETLPVLKEQFDKPFAQAEEYEAKKKRLSDLTAELSAEGKDSSPTAMSMRAEAGDGEISSDEAERIISEFRKQYPAAPTSVLVENFEELPEQARKEAEMQGGNAYNTHGMMHGGVMYIVRDSHANRESLETTIFHELVGHFGLRNLLGQDFVRKTNQLYAQLGGIDGLRRLAEKEGFTAEFNDYAKGLVGAYQKNPEVFTEGFVKMLLTEEAFAHVAQNRPTIATHIKALVGMIRDFLRSLGFFKGKELNQYDVAHILSQVRRKLTADGVVVTGDSQKPMAKMQERETIDVDGVERPATNSKGQAIHPTEEGIRNFWRWFGSGAFVDEAGRPVVFYHSTLEDKAQFDKHGAFMGHTGVSGISVTDSAEMASRYLDRFGSFRYDGEAFEKNVMAVYINAKNPLYRQEPFQTNLRLGAPLPAGYVSEVEKLGHDALVREDAISRKGVVKHSDAKSAIRGKEIVIFDPSGIKSATGNAGTFDSSNPSILASRPAWAGWSPERVDSLVREFSYDFDPRRTKAFAAYVKPDDFLAATTPKGERDKLEAESAPLDRDGLKNESQPIYLTVRQTNEEGVFQITGHEGRHRMMALRDAGYSRVPVVMIFPDAVYDAEAVEEPYFVAQKFGDGSKGVKGFSAREAIPITSGNRQELAESFSDPASGPRDVMFSRPAERTAETPASIRSALVERFGEEGIAALESSGLLKIVPSMDAVPAGVRIDGAEAVYDPTAGAAYLVADRMSANRAAAALLHELGEHHGLEGFIGKPAWMLVKARVSALAQRAGSYASGAWAGVKATYPEFEGMADADLAKNDRFIHEVLAKIGESGGERKSSLWRDLVSAIKRGMLRLGFSFQINEDDVRDLVAGSLRRLMRGGDGGPRGGLPLAQMAWHGSPHKFDKFSTDAIGTGEGAQAYGWGLYFAGRKDVAEWYREKLSAMEYRVDGEAPDESVAGIVSEIYSAMHPKALLSKNRVTRTPGEAIDKLVAEANNNIERSSENPSLIQKNRYRIEVLESMRGKTISRERGALYEVEIPEDDEYLLWDKPLSEQPEKVREALNLSRWQEFAFRKDGTPRNLKGADLYHEVIKETGSDKEASLALHSAGIAGIKYLDGTSRNAGDGSYNYVVFDDSRVSIQAMASRAFNAADFIRSPKAGQQIRNKVSDLFRSGRTFNVLHRTVGTQYHKAKVDPRYFGRVFNMAQQYIDDISRTANEAADVAPDLLPKMERMTDAFKQLWHARADAKDAQALAAPIFDGTMDDKVWSDDELRQQYNLDDRQIGLYRQFRAAVDRSLDELALSEMARTAKMAKLEAAPREMSLRDALAFYMEQVSPDIEQLQGELAELKERQKFERDQLEEAAQNGDSGSDERRRYADLRESMKARHAAESAALKARIDDMGELLKATQGKVEQIEKLKATGYAPLMRFGQYTVDVFEAGDDGKPLKNADGEEIRHFFGMFESEAEANEAARALREEYPNATINQGVMSQDSFRLFRGVTPETVEVFARMMGEEQSEVFQKYLKQAVNNRSALKRLIQRKGIAGFEKDPVRVLATFLTSNARATAANYHFGDMLRAASEIPKEKGDVKDEAIKLIDYIQNPGDEAASMRGLLFMHFLGGSVAAAMVNMTQTFTMTLPYLAQFGGDVAGNLKEAMGLAGRRLFNKNADVPEELKMALQRASDEGVVSPHEIHMLQGESMRTGWFQNNRYMRSIGKVWGSFFSLAEHFNRDVAFIAAYRSALQRNLSDEQAYEFAKDAVRETQGVYSRANKPNWARGAVGATIFTFKQFSIGYMEFLKRLPPRERALALGILWVFAGMSGMPFSDDLDDLIDTIAHMLGFAWDNKAKKRAFVAGVFGRDAGEYIMNGVSAGLPLDISGRMGLANLIPATGVLDPSKDRAKELSEVAGPAGAAIQTIVKAGDRMLSGIGSMRDVRDIARMSAPVAVANLMAGWNMAEDGYYTDTKGRKVVDTDMKDAFFKTLGFNPSVVSESSRAREEIFNRSAVLRDMKERISERWADGIANRNPEKVAEARAVLARWNENNPDDQIRVNMAGILRRAKEARATASDRAIKAAPKELRETAKMLVDGTD